MAIRYVTPADVNFDSDGVTPLNGGLLNFYIVGTLTRKNTFSDNALTVVNANPVVLSSVGLEPNIFLDGAYRVILTDSSGTQIWDRDNVNSTAPNPFDQSLDTTDDVTFNSAVITTTLDISGALTADAGGSLTGTWSDLGTVTTVAITTITGNPDIVGDLTVGTITADGDTSAGDNATLGFTATEGLILTGQGSTNDITLKNDADASVMHVLAGTTNVNFDAAITVATNATLTSGDLTLSEGKLDITDTANEVALAITSSHTTADGMTFSSTTATTGNNVTIDGNSSNVGTRSVLQVTQNHVSAVGTTALTVTQDAVQRALFIDQNGNGISLEIDSESTSAAIISLLGPTLTTGTALLISSCDALTTGGIASFVSNSAETDARTLLNIDNQNALSSGTTIVSLKQESDQKVLFIDQNGNAPCIQIDSESTSQPVFNISGTAQTSGKIIDITAANSLTTGTIFRGISNSSDTGARNLVEIINDNASAVNATPLKLQQDAINKVMTLDQNATGAGASFINFEGAIEANATSPISSFTTSGATTNHIQIELNDGTKAWIAISTNDPS